MKKLVRFAYVLGILFWAVFLIIGFAKLFVFNGLGDYYDFPCRVVDDFHVAEMPNHFRISYSYSDGLREHQKIEELSKEFFRDRIGEVPSTLTICYNSKYPSLSYIENANLSIIQATNGIIISGIFLVFISGLYLFARRDSWLKKYKDFFSKLVPTKQ